MDVMEIKWIAFVKRLTCFVKVHITPQNLVVLPNYFWDGGHEMCGFYKVPTLKLLLPLHFISVVNFINTHVSKFILLFLTTHRHAVLMRYFFLFSTDYLIITLVSALFLHFISTLSSVLRIFLSINSIYKFQRISDYPLLSKNLSYLSDIKFI